MPGGAIGDAKALLADTVDDIVILGCFAEISTFATLEPELGAKAWQWLRRGARLVWVVWPKRRQVDVWTPGRDEPTTLQAGDTLDGAGVLPGFTYALADLFA